MTRRLQFALWHTAARVAANFRGPAVRLAPLAPLPPGTPRGVTVVIPSRNGRELLAAQLPGILAAQNGPFEIVVVDNGSDDGTPGWLAAEYPAVVVDLSPEPLSFATAVNRGIARGSFSHVCLLNNDMLLDPQFFPALFDAFDAVPHLFCATAQIFFPAGVRREETGKAVMAHSHPDDFPLRCDEPLPGEDLTWVLYGSGGCSLYDAALLRTLGGFDEAYAPAYVEDLDLGYRAWQRGWPTVFAARALVEHRHRATTSRYYSEQQLAEILEINYLRFLARAVAYPPLFHTLWREAIDRLRRRRNPVLQNAAAIARSARPALAPSYAEEEFLALTCGDVAVFPGGNRSGAAKIDYVDRLETPSLRDLAAHREVILVRAGNRRAMEAAVRWSRDKGADRNSMRSPACPEN